MHDGRWEGRRRTRAAYLGIGRQASPYVRGGHDASRGEGEGPQVGVEEHGRGLLENHDSSTAPQETARLVAAEQVLAPAEQDLRDLTCTCMSGCQTCRISHTSREVVGKAHVGGRHGVGVADEGVEEERHCQG